MQKPLTCAKDFSCRGKCRNVDQKSMPPMPGPAGSAGPGVALFGNSATIASVVINSPATEDAFWTAMRTTLVGSMIPFERRLLYSPACASKPKRVLLVIEHLADHGRTVFAGVDRDLT